MQFKIVGKTTCFVQGAAIFGGNYAPLRIVKGHRRAGEGGGGSIPA
jgi:hypothetical protein